MLKSYLTCNARIFLNENDGVSLTYGWLLSSVNMASRCPLEAERGCEYKDGTRMLGTHFQPAIRWSLMCVEG